MNQQVIIVFGILFTICYCDDNVIFPNVTNNIGDECSLSKQNVTGTCLRIQDCQIKYNTNKRPQVCTYEQSIPIVCCPNSTKKRISETKCDEYIKYAEVFRKLPPGAQGIVGGSYTQPAEFPHMAAIGWTQDDGKIQWKCGGSLISEFFVLSAAHCAFRELPDIIRLGEHDLLDDNDFVFPEQIKIAEIIRHPAYRSTLNYNDIALFKLDKTFEFYNSIRPACLWQNNYINKTIATATGWGQVEYAGGTSSTLKKVDLQLFENENCKTYYEITRKIPNGILETQVCYGDLNGGQDTCQGDSGGPIQIRRSVLQSHVYDIVGISSFGKFCGTKSPSVYTRVSTYLDWIESIVWPNKF